LKAAKKAVIADIDSMNKPISQPNTINNAPNLTDILIERLDLWDQQDLAQAAGELHQAVEIERQVRTLSSQIRLEMGFLVPAQEVAR